MPEHPPDRFWQAPGTPPVLRDRERQDLAVARDVIAAFGIPRELGETWLRGIDARHARKWLWQFMEAYGIPPHIREAFGFPSSPYLGL